MLFIVIKISDRENDINTNHYPFSSIHTLPDNIPVNSYPGSDLLPNPQSKLKPSNQFISLQTQAILFQVSINLMTSPLYIIILYATISLSHPDLNSLYLPPKNLLH